SEGAGPNPNAAEIVYTLARKTGGVQMTTVPLRSSQGGATGFYVRTLELEQNKTYQSGLLEAPDLWLWDAVVSPNTRTYAFTLDQVASTPEPAHVTVF